MLLTYNILCEVNTSCQIEINPAVYANFITSLDCYSFKERRRLAYGYFKDWFYDSDFDNIPLTVSDDNARLEIYDIYHSDIENEKEFIEATIKIIENDEFRNPAAIS